MNDSDNEPDETAEDAAPERAGFVGGIIGHLRGLNLVWLLVAVAISVVVIVIGVIYVNDIVWKSSQRKNLTYLAFGFTALGIVLAEILRQWRILAGVAMALFTAIFFVVAIQVLPDDLDLGHYSESERMPLASADQVPDAPAERPDVDPPVATSGEELLAISLGVELVAEGFEQPVKVVPSTLDGELLVVERAGLIRRITADGTVADEPVLDLTDELDAIDEQGLLSIALSPHDDRIYTSWSVARGDDDVSGISSYDFDGETADPDSRRNVVEVPQPYERHNAGDIAWGHDGYLYWSLGDGGRIRDPHGMGQDTSTRLSTIMRFLPTPDGDTPYVIPPDNPYVDTADIWPEIFAYGARNPFRFSFDSDTGDLWIGDVSEVDFEEVNYIEYGDTDGANFGWRIMQGNDVFLGPDHDPTGYTEADIPADHTPPIYAYPHDKSEKEGGRNSITGGVVYRSDAIPELWGSYVFADFTAGWYGLMAYDSNNDEVVGDALMVSIVAEGDAAGDVEAAVAINVDGDGEILFVTFSGAIYRLIPGS
ncbi:MAG: PQQ-dependent sugar dehydrogenase [Acidobacteria bacterium]|nr:PQQ-dependent sugar dehydrogenase [Acidobacteriota bacterium]